MDKTSKSIIMGAPSHFGIVFKIKEELRALGFDIQDFVLNDQKFKYKNIGQRLYNLYRKSVYKDLGYKTMLKEQVSKDYLQTMVRDMSPSAFGLIIRPDLYPLDILKQLRKKVDKFIAYQWDGLNRYPNVKDYIDLFDKFYIFDPADTTHPKVLPTTNFHMNSNLTDLYIPKKTQKIYYIGSYENSRLDTLLDIASCFDRLPVEKEILLFTNNENIYRKANRQIDTQKGITIITSAISYHENLKNVKDSSILLDLHAHVHQGISFRIFEAIGYDKKVITTNEAVKNYDFYDPQNILIWQNQSSGELLTFLNSPYVKLPNYIKQKYSLNNWIKYMLDLDSYIPINLPVGQECGAKQDYQVISSKIC